MSRSLPTKAASRAAAGGSGAGLSVAARIQLLLGAGAVAGVFLVACLLRPDPRGYGTHQQLGLPPCAFRALTGIRCPSCGLTTCFAHLVRGRVVRAARCNAAGPVVAAGLVVLGLWCLFSAAVGRRIGTGWLWRAAPVALVIVVAIDLADWLVRACFFGGQG